MMAASHGQILPRASAAWLTASALPTTVSWYTSDEAEKENVEEIACMAPLLSFVSRGRIHGQTEYSAAGFRRCR